MTRRFDAIVIGGGPAGATTALLLARAGWAVVLLERKPFPRRKVCGEYLSFTNWPLLEAIGVSDTFHGLAGPEVRRVGLFAGKTRLSAELPRATHGFPRWGRALSREQLDTLLLRRAYEVGVEIHQPWVAVALEADADGYLCRAESRDTEGNLELHAPIVIAAHGSWESGSLPTQSTRPSHRPGDLFGFKAHLRNCDLPAELMPLLAFPDGYGGMVHTDRGRVSFSCCVRRDRLECIRRILGRSVGEAVLGHILDSCPAARPALARAALEGPWLSTGPIRPGFRPPYQEGIFLVGNSAAEAHPVVAEGISMAMQSAWLLVKQLVPHRGRLRSCTALRAAGKAYAASLRRTFAPRVYAASVFAHWAMRPTAVKMSLPLLKRYPRLLTMATRLSGKATWVLTHRLGASQWV